MSHPLFLVFAAVFAAVALVLQPQAALSALLGLSCVAIPQYIAMFAMRRAAAGGRSVGGIFKVWGLKFSLTLLFLALSIKGIAAAGLMSAPFFVAGAVAGVSLNILLAARMPAAAKE